MSIEKIKKYQFILASSSPRRQELMTSLGLDFKIIKPDVEEIYGSHLKEEEITNYLAELKADSLASELNVKDLLITADTIVWHRGKPVEKPKNAKEAKKMLASLSGSSHKVITSVCLRTSSKQVLFHDTTMVYFSNIDTEEIDYYVRTFSPFDKAGAYGIQEWIGLIAVARLEGSYFNVMGLPVHKLWQELQKL